MTNQSSIDYDVQPDRDIAGPATIAQLLLRAAAEHPDAGVRYATDESTSVLQRYPELVDRARRILGGLRERGLDPGRKVALLLDQPEDFLPAFWACVLGGLVPCPLVPIRTDAQRWAAQLAHVNELLDGPLLVTTPGLARELPDVPGLAVAALPDLPAAPEPGTHRAEPADVAVLVLTSGSTGNAKAVMLTHANLLASMAGKNERQRLGAADITLNWISFDHVAALLECHLLPLFVGATQVHVDPQMVLGDPLTFLRLLDTHRVSMTFTPNFLLGHLNKALAGGGPALDLAALRHIVSGGEATVCATAQTFLDLLAPAGLSRSALWPAFGMTETCAGSIYSREFPDIDAGEEFASLGLPVQGLELRVVDEDDRALPAGETGELQLRGPMICAGYFNNPAATAAAFTADGWFRSGDLGKLDDAGRLTLVGRSKDSIIVDGVNYFSHDLETVLDNLDGVRRSYVAAFPTREPGSDTEALVVTFVPDLAPDEDDDEAELHRVLIAVRNSVVLHWGFRPALILPLSTTDVPKTSLGKIQRSVLRRRLEAGEFADAQRWITELTTRQLGGHSAPVGEVETALAEIYGEMFDVDPAEISATASFFELGGTSLDILRLKRRAEHRLGRTEVPVMWILLAPTVRELAAKLTGDTVAAGGYDPVVPLQSTGEKTPLFCVHPGVGEVLVFVNLAKYFVHERPIYALRARGFGPGEPFFETFPEMVDCYVRAIREKQPHGPYAVSGYSYGGAVAFEIAKVLEAAGERVDFVGIFNLPPHIKYRMAELDFVEGAVNLALFLSLISKQDAAELPGTLRDTLPDKQSRLEYLMGIADADRLAELDLDLAKFTAWAELTQSLLKMGREYEPSGSVRSLQVFYAIPLQGTKEDWLNTQLRVWDEFAREPNHYIDVPGEHYTLMGPEHVAEFQAILRRELDRAVEQ